MRVLVTVPGNQMAGVQRRVLEVAPRLSHSHGMQILVLIPDGPGVFADLASRAGIDVHRLALPRLRRPRSATAFLESAKWLGSLFLANPRVKAIVRQGIDVVHVNGLLWANIALTAFGQGVPVIWHLIGNHYPRALVRAMMPTVLRLSKLQVLVASSMCEYYFGNKLPPTARIMYEPVDTDFFSPHAVPPSVVRQTRLQLGVDEDTQLIGAVGNITPAKGYEHLIRALYKVLRMSPAPVKLVIVGAPLRSHSAYARKLRTLVRALGLEDVVLFTGYRQDVRELMAAFDLFVLSSLLEGTPIAVLEAMSMARPVVATNVGGVAEQVVNGGTGVLVPPQDPDRLADAIVGLLTDTEARLQLGQAGRERAKSLFSVHHCVRQHEQLYLEVGT